jgi:hypothetical protein
VSVAEKRREPLLSVRRVVLVLLAVGAVALIVVGTQLTRSPDQTQKPAGAIEHLIPGNGDLDLRQSDIGVDLKTGYDARLVIDGQPIPDDQVHVVRGLGTFMYRPGPGTATGQLTPGLHRATVIYWPNTKSEATDAQSRTWTFNAH